MIPLPVRLRANGRIYRLIRRSGKACWYGQSAALTGPFQRFVVFKLTRNQDDEEIFPARPRKFEFYSDAERFYNKNSGLKFYER